MLQSYKLEADLRKYAGITPYEDWGALQRNLRVRVRADGQGEIPLSSVFSAEVDIANSGSGMERLAALENLFYMSGQIRDNMYRMRLFPDVKRYFTDLQQDSASGLCCLLSDELSHPANHGSTYEDMTGRVATLGRLYADLHSMMISGLESYAGASLMKLNRQAIAKVKELFRYMVSDPSAYPSGMALIHDLAQIAGQEYLRAVSCGKAALGAEIIENIGSLYAGLISSASAEPIFVQDPGSGQILMTYIADGMKVAGLISERDELLRRLQEG